MSGKVFGTTLSQQLSTEIFSWPFTYLSRLYKAHGKIIINVIIIFHRIFQVEEERNVSSSVTVTDHF
jgi:uncharacterized membrane protein